MTKKNRTILFIFLAILFFLSAPAIILYSGGWRLDFQKKRITQTGGLSFKVVPKNAQVYIDGKFLKKTDFLFGTLFTENLLPEKYKIIITKDGYHTWGKTLEVKEKEVTEAKNIVLIPEKPFVNILSKEIDDFFPSPDGKKLIFKKGGKDACQLSLFDIERNVQVFLVEKKGELFNLMWSDDSKRVFLETAADEKIKYFILDLEKTSDNLISLDFPIKDIEQISFNPKDSQKLFFLKRGFLYEQDYVKKELKGPFLNNIISYATLNDNVYFLDNSGFLFKTDFSLEPKEQLNDISFPVRNETEYKIILADPYIFLKENSALYHLTADSKSFEKLFEPIKELKISRDLKKAVYFSDNEIWILFLTDMKEQPQKKKNDKLFITRFSEKISDVFWFTDHYLIFNAGNVIKVAEIDDRDRIQVWDLLYEFKNPKIFYNRNNKTLYILSNGNLYNSSKLTP